MYELASGVEVGHVYSLSSNEASDTDATPRDSMLLSVTSECSIFLTCVPSECFDLVRNADSTVEVRTRITDEVWLEFSCACYIHTHQGNAAA